MMMMNKSIFFKPISYPGLTFTAPQIGPYFPKTKYYVEPFSGLARTAKYSRSEVMILNDKSKFSNNYCKKKFRNAVITNEDFEVSIKRWDSKDTFFLIDPPWRVEFYNGKGMLHRNKSATNPAFIDRSIPEYLNKLKQILPLIKGHYILTLGNTLKFTGPFFKKIQSLKKDVFQFHAKTNLYSNKPLEIQIPQIIDYV